MYSKRGLRGCRISRLNWGSTRIPRGFINLPTGCLCIGSLGGRRWEWRDAGWHEREEAGERGCVDGRTAGRVASDRAGGDAGAVDVAVGAKRRPRSGKVRLLWGDRKSTRLNSSHV